MVYQQKGYYDIIRFSNTIILEQARKKCEQNFHYRIKKWKKEGSFEVLNYIRKNVTLVTLMEILGNADHSVSITVNLDI